MMTEPLGLHRAALIIIVPYGAPFASEMGGGQSNYCVACSKQCAILVYLYIPTDCLFTASSYLL